MELGLGVGTGKTLLEDLRVFGGDAFLFGIFHRRSLCRYDPI
jgi:hypothetical protein